MKQTILFVAANPHDTDTLALARECEALQHELRLTTERDQFEFHSRWAVGVDQLMRALNETPPAIVHFSGHGTGDAGSTAGSNGGTHRDIQLPGDAGIVLEGSGGAQHVGHRALASMIASFPLRPRLVVLNACHSADVADSLREVVDCVVGVAGAITDAAAREFTVAFYRALGHGHSVGTAVKQARASMEARQLPGQLVTCHPRRGVNADELYLVASSRATTVRATSLPMGSGTWPEAAAPYDLFLAHPPANRATAGALYDLLQPDLRVFLAARSLSTSDRWEQAVAAAQRNSRAAVLLISRQADASWYLGDECITAIALHRAAPDVHRILPVLLTADLPLPHCLGDLRPMVAPTAGDLGGVAAELRELVALLPRTAAPWSTPPPVRPATGDHVRLYGRLCQLTDHVFERIVGRANVDRSSFAPRTAPLAQRALDIAQLAALDPALCQRISTEIDRQAPGIRR